MTYLVLGLLIFLGVHSVRIVADTWRSKVQAQYGEAVYKGIYSLLSLLGLGLIVWGFSVVRETPVYLWQPPVGMRHAAALLMLPAFILLAAAYVPANAFKARFLHPMVLGVKTWAVAHLLTTGTVAHAVLFGSFLLWGVLLFIASRRRDRRNHTQYAIATTRGTVVTLVIGAAAWGLFAFLLHGLLTGIRPLG